MDGISSVWGECSIVNQPARNVWDIHACESNVSDCQHVPSNGVWTVCAARLLGVNVRDEKEMPEDVCVCVCAILRYF